MLTHQVFGIAPEVREYSYVDRGNLDETLEAFLARSVHVAIKGPSKSGKSWLRQKALAGAITVQCRHNKPFTDIYVDALSQLNIRTEVKKTEQGVFKATITATGEAGAYLLAKVSASAGVAKETGATTETKYVGHDVNDLRFAADLIKASGKRLVIEDFHYMSVEDRRGFAFDLKALWDYGLFVVIVGIWAESNLILHLNTDLTGRVHEIAVDWSREDLKKILAKGSAQLNVKFTDELQEQLATLAYSNAGILQQLALFTLDDAKVREKTFFQQVVSNKAHVDSATMFYADQLNPVYQQFAKRVSAGIRSRQRATGIYAHSIAVIMEASDEELMRGFHARTICERAVKRQPRIQYGNLKAILEKMESLQIDKDGRGLLIAYNGASEEVTIVDRQLLLYRRYATIKWPWEDLIVEAETQGGQVDAD
jgi:hypothetical protein